MVTVQGMVKITGGHFCNLDGQHVPLASACWLVPGTGSDIFTMPIFEVPLLCLV